MPLRANSPLSFPRNGRSLKYDDEQAEYYTRQHMIKAQSRNIRRYSKQMNVLKKSMALLIFLPALAVSACGGSPQSSPAEAVSAAPETATPTPSATPTQSKSARGNTISFLGETRNLSLKSTGKTVLVYTVKDVVPVTCDYPVEMKPSNGQVMGVLLDIQTGTASELEDTDLAQGLDINALSFKMIRTDGTTVGTLSTDMIYNCLTDRTQLLPNSIGPAEKVSGMVLLDVPSTSGTLIFEPIRGAGGVEYPLK